MPLSTGVPRLLGLYDCWLQHVEDKVFPAGLFFYRSFKRDVNSAQLAFEIYRPTKSADALHRAKL